MKRILVTILIGIAVILALGFLFGRVNATAPAKVTICHATSSETNPFVRIVVSENATGGHFDNPGTTKAGHENDILLQGEQECPEKPSEEPKDVCPNIDGVQVELPEGYSIVDRECVQDELPTPSEDEPQVTSTPRGGVDTGFGGLAN